MPIVNFNDTVPAAPSGAMNVKWQNDGSANMSAYVPAQSWTTWTPTFSADSGTFTLNNLYLAQYVQNGPTIFFELRFQATVSGAPGFLTATVPFTAIAANNFAAISPAIAEVAPGPMTAMTQCPARIQTPNLIAIGRETGLSTWPAGSYLFAVSGFYRSA